MPNNILSAISNIVAFGSNDLRNYASTYLIRINAVGEQLEFYIKDAIAGSFKLSQDKKEEAYSKVFSYLGNQNNPPDMIIKGSDAFEIKKIESPRAALALNSSPPKDKLLSDDIRITAACKNCEAEEWKEKDLFYVIGHAQGGEAKYLFFIQGTCYAANHQVYEKERKNLKKIRNKDSFNFNPRYGRIKNPLIYFKKYFEYTPNKFNIYAVIETKKYLSFSRKDRRDLESFNNIEVKDINIPLPANQNQMMDAKLISCVI